jgi:diguanylate cyclase (GGDEF)-like protein
MPRHPSLSPGDTAISQSWVPVLTANGFLLCPPAVAGVPDPQRLYPPPSADAQPDCWAAVHGGFVLAASAGSLTAWRIVEQQSLHDDLTGLPNRVRFDERVEQGGPGGRDGAPVAVLFIDLDDFKHINDTLGHAVGDEVLRSVGERLKGAVRAGDVVARYGGDEFTVFLPTPGSAEAVLAVVHRMRRTVSAPVGVQGQEVVPSITIGIAIGKPGEDPGSLIRDADMAMYHAKRRGSGGWAIFEPGMRAAVVDRARMRLDLAAAIADNALRVAFQPIVDLASGAPIGAEALARWTHAERGPIAPADFIPVAEEGDLIVALGHQVITETCRRAAEWIRDGVVGPEFWISVNLSARQIREPGVVDFLDSVTAECGLDPARLVVEITEGVMLQDTDSVIETLSALRRLGIRLALDDFGTGYSSLGYLRRFPIDILKIDRAFVADLTAPDGTSTFVRTILSLAGSLGLETIAEGVEEAGQADQLRALGCDRGQGYLFARPVEGDEFEALVRDTGPGVR